MSILMKMLDGDSNIFDGNGKPLTMKKLMEEA
jgi:hypothetical protein